MRLRVARVLLVAAAVAAVLAVWAWVTGGFRVHFLGVPLSVRGEHRAAFIALVLGTIGFFLHTGLRQRVAAARGRLSLPPFETLLFPAAALAAVALLWLALTYGSRAATGSDSYGYVSQADLWRAGDLHIRQPFAASVPWPNGEWTFAPLGYKPAGDHTIVPTYSPGYPLLMAFFTLIFGAQGPYYVTPLCGAALVLLTYALGTRLSGRVVGTVGALSVACSPTVVFMTLSVMSDIPVAAFWAAAILLATRQTAAAALASGVASGIAIVIRPNLVFVALIPMLMVAWPRPNRSFADVVRRALVFAVASAPFALFIGWLFNDLYGSPFRSGYGGNDALFALGNVRPNLARYPAWLLESQGPLVYLFLASPFVALWRRDRSPLRWLYAAFVLVVVAAYLVYLPFDAWWYLRFLLPAFPFIFVLASDAVWTAAGPLAPDKRNLAMALFAIIVVGLGLGKSIGWDLTVVGRGEAKYIDVGRYLDQVLPANAVVYSQQHSGSIRYYSGRLTLRYDYLPPNWLDPSIEYMQRAGYEAFFLLDDWELPVVRERFASQARVAGISEEPRDRPCTYTTFLYRVVPRPGELPSVRVPKLSGCD